MPRWWLTLLSVCLLALILSGCNRERRNDVPEIEAPATIPGTSNAKPIPGGVSRGVLEFDGLERSYRLFIPSGLSAQNPAPLVVALHGGLGSGEQFSGASNFETLAESEGFVVVFPDGLDKTWNAGGCCGQSVRKGTNDVGFLAALIQELSLALPLDSEQVLMTGHSNGAMMAFRFGCQRADLVKAIAPVAASLEIPTCLPNHGVSLLAIHGDSDQNHPLEGGQGPRSLAGVDFISMDDSLALWTSAMACETTPEHSVAGALTSTVWIGCADGSRSTFMVIADADHPWLGGVAGAPLIAGRPSDALDGTHAVWTFFKTLP
jgi:polyhydroxybutyrate depolymerase